MSEHRTVWRYVMPILLVACTLWLRLHILVSFGQRPLLILFVLPIIICAYYGGIRAGLLTTALTAITTCYLLVPPIHSFRIAEQHDLLQWLMLVADGVLISVLAGRFHTVRGRLVESLKATQSSQAKHEALLNHITTAVVVHAPDTRILYCNPAAATILGLSVEQMQGKEAIDPAWHFEREDGTPMPLADYPINRVLSSGKALVDYVVGAHIPGRPQITWVLVNAYPEFTAAGAIVQVLVTFTDITHLRSLEAQLTQAQKMEAIGRLAGGVAHDFNNILQAINGFTELAEADLDAGHPCRPYLDEVVKAGGRAAKLVNQLLAFSRRQILKPTNLDLNVLVDDFMSMLSRMIGEHIKIDFIPGHHLGTVRADASLIEQIVMNLCVNARDAMPQGGLLTIELENVMLDGEYCAQNLWARPGRYVLLTVTDTGTGMESETLEHIFEPFFTTKGVGKGTGLGLSMVYGVVRQHEGMVKAYSEPGKGTSIKVYLPIVERPVDTVGTKIEALPSGGCETILVAEDDNSLRELARQTLERAGYRVILANDGMEAVARFQENPSGIHLLLLDVVMPKMGGREAMDRIHAIRPEVPVIFASGYSENAIHVNFVIKEGLHLIRKPYNTRELLQSIRTVLDASDK